jgi:uncharacterized membrane protein
MMPRFREPGTAGSVQNIILAIFLTAVLLVTAAAAYYFTTMPEGEEPFTEFYIDPPEEIAQDYPTRFVMQGNEIISVTYGPNGGHVVASESGMVMLGIVNHEYEEATYVVKVTIDGEPVEISLGDTVVDEAGPIVLAHEEKWQQEIGFAPLHTGDGQKVEFILYKDGVTCFKEPLYLWIDVKAQD